MGHSISVNLIIKAQKFRAGRDFRDHLVNSFSLKVKKRDQETTTDLPQAIELVTGTWPVLPPPPPLCHIVLSQKAYDT